MGNAKKTSLSEGEMSVQTKRSKEVIFIQPVIIGMIFYICARKSSYIAFLNDQETFEMIFYICARKSSPAHIFSAQPPCRAFTAIVLYILRS